MIFIIHIDKLISCVCYHVHVHVYVLSSSVIVSSNQYAVRFITDNEI